MLEYSIGSSMNRDDLYAELSSGEVQWGEIVLSEDRTSVNIIIYPDYEETLNFNYKDFLTIIETAKRRLLEIEGLDLSL